MVKGHIPFICLAVISNISNMNTKYKGVRFCFSLGGGAPVHYTISVLEEPATLALGIEE